MPKQCVRLMAIVSTLCTLHKQSLNNHDRNDHQRDKQMMQTKTNMINGGCGTPNKVCFSIVMVHGGYKDAEIVENDSILHQRMIQQSAIWVSLLRIHSMFVRLNLSEHGVR